MDGGVHRKHQPENDQARDQDQSRIEVCNQSSRNQRGEEGEQEGESCSDSSVRWAFVGRGAAIKKGW